MDTRIDWSDTAYTYVTEVAVVSQTNVNTILGYLSGVQLSGMTVTENYNSDSRVQAKVSTVVAEGTSDGYVSDARLCFILLIPSRSWSEELVTGYVTNYSEKSEHGYIKRDYTIEGTIWGLLNHKVDSLVSIGKGTGLIATWNKLMGLTKMQYSSAGAQDHNWPDTTTYEAGTNLGTLLFEVSSGYNRMDTNGHGVVLLKKYVEPSIREAEYTIDFASLRGLAMSPLQKSFSKWEAPGRAIVTTTVSKEDKDGNTVQEVITGSYDAPDTHFTSINTRGWLRGRLDSYTGAKDNPTKTDLEVEAKKNWEKSLSDSSVTWTASSVFSDYHAGDVAMLITQGDAAKGNYTGRKVLLENVVTNLENFTQDLTMKEV